MQKIALIFLVLFGCSHASHLQRLNQAYPNGLIGDDYGVLTVEDLAVNTCYLIGENTYPPEGASPYRYWQCFFTKDVSISCEYDAEQDKETSTSMAMDVVGQDRRQSYVGRQMMDLARCTGFQNDLKKLSEHESHVCISGEFIESGSRNEETAWVFDKFKTTKGCVSYWDECDLKEQIAKGCKPRPPKK